MVHPRTGPSLRRRLSGPIEPTQYTSLGFSTELLEAEIAGSIGTVGDASDNAPCQSTIGLFKTEAINDGGPTWTDRSGVERQVVHWVAWYDRQRLHSSIGFLPPVEFKHHQRQAQTITPDAVTDSVTVNQPALR